MCKLLLASMQYTCAILSFVMCLDIKQYCTLFHNWHNVLKKKRFLHEVYNLNLSINKYIYEIIFPKKTRQRYDQKHIPVIT